MKLLYKLTEQNRTTYFGKTTWGKNITHSLPEKENPQLCSGDVLHAYTNINIAFLLNPIHANISTPLVWEAKGEVVVSDFGKVGCFSLTTIRQLKYPEWVGSDNEWRVRLIFAILCVETVLHLFKRKFPDDRRVVTAINVAKKYLNNPSYKSACAAFVAEHTAYVAADLNYVLLYFAIRKAHAAAAAAAKTVSINFEELADRAVNMGSSSLIETVKINQRF